jgi:hypothetical protein
MIKQSAVQRFRAMESDLQANPLIKVVLSEFNPPATAEELDEARNQFDLTAAMVDFYGEANGIQIHWERREQKEIAGGGLATGLISLLPVQEVFGDWEDIIYFEDNDRFKSLYPLDFFVEEACAALYLDGSKNPAVYYHYCGEEMSPMGVDFAGYLELLLKSRGFWYWHLALTQSEDAIANAPMSIEEKNFREIMPQLFPDFKAADFKRAT